jgi:pilus assembly protein CpaC
MFIFNLLLAILISGNVWAQELILKPGETKTLSATGKAWVEKSKVIKLSDAGNKFVIKGIRPGTSLLKIGTKSYDISVLSPAQEKAWRKLEGAVQRTLNLQLSLSEGKVRVQGHLVRWNDWETLYKACRNNDCDYVLEVTMKDSLRAFSQKRISEIFQQHGLPPQNLMFEQQMQALVSDKGETATRVTRLLKALGVHVIPTSSNLDLVPLIRVQITVAEVRKNETLNYGIKWPGSYSAQILPSYAPDSTARTLDVHFLEQKGVAKILASPNILCRSGKDASFFAGGEFPIKIMNYKVQDVVWKKYGIVMKVKPTADFSGKMSISIETEVSSIDKSRSVDGVPALFTNKIQSHFELNGPRTIALSGLIKSDQSQNNEGLPGLSRIPVFGALFGSQEFQDNRTELVVFVKPEVISPGSLEASL